MKILLADDHYVFREGLRTLLSTVPEMDVVGEATTSDEAVQAALRLEPDLVLMDLEMPGGGGVWATAAIRSKAPHVRILVLTMFADSAHIAEAVAAGAHGYLLKDAGPEEIVRSLLSVKAGQFVLGSGLDAEPQHLLQPKRTRPLPELSDRELEILDLMAQGIPNEGIAVRLELTIKTIRNHVSNIYAKLLVADRAQAVLKARDAGLGLRPR